MHVAVAQCLHGVEDGVGEVCEKLLKADNVGLFCANDVQSVERGGIAPFEDVDVETQQLDVVLRNGFHILGATQLYVSVYQVEP